MTRHLFRITACLALLGCLMGSAALERLRDRYERQVEAKVAPLRNEYLSSLKKLRTQLGKSGKLQEAVKVDREIQRLERFNGVDPHDLVGKWALATDRKKTFEFKANGQCVSPWSPTKIVSWSYLEGDEIHLHTSDRKVVSLPYSHKRNAFAWPDDGSIWVQLK